MSKVNKVYRKYMDGIKKMTMDFPWDDEETYAHWLAQTYHYVKYSTRLLTLSSTHIPVSNSQLHNRFIDHAKEERNHEFLCVNDLKAMGRSIDDFEENYAASGLYQSQFYWIQNYGPMAFFGYILFLEGIGAEHCGEAYQAVIKAHGKKAGTFLRVHSEEDEDHIAKAFHQISLMGKNDQEAIVLNFTQTANLYYLMLKEAMEMGKGKKRSGIERGFSSSAA